MRLPIRLSVLFSIGIVLVGSTALGYYYYYVYSPPLKLAEQFLTALELKDASALRDLIVISVGLDAGDLRQPTEVEIRDLLAEGFDRGRILDQRKREGKTRPYQYLVYREPDGTLYALVVTEFEGRLRIVIPASPMSERHKYLWDYTWTN